MIRKVEQNLTLRVTPAEKRAIQLAARGAERSVCEFVLESALKRAEEMRPDRQRFGLDAAKWSAFQVALSAPTQPSSRLARLLREPSVFDSAK